MQSNYKTSSVAVELRRQAEQRIKALQIKANSTGFDADAHKLLHELQVYQVELEMQNDELRAARANAEVLAEKYAELYDFAPVSYLTFDRDGTICQANLACASLLGNERSLLIRKRLALHVAAEDRPVFDGFIKRVFATNAIQSCEVTMIRQGKPPAEVRIEAEVAVPGAECLAVMTDITERKRTEAGRLISSKLESAGILAGGIAHDFNNLLTVIRMNLDMAERLTPGAGELAGYLTAAKQGSMVASGLTQRLITFAEGGAPMRKAVLLPAVIEEAIRPITDGSHTRRDLSLPGDLWPVDADDRQVAQVLQNIVQNAVEAMRGPSVVIVRAENLTLDAKSDLALSPGDYVRISVTDHGCGIAPQVLPKIFDPYFSTKQRGDRKGMGLGLTIAHTIIHKHGGAITVESKKGTGTTFHVYLPAFRNPRVEQEPNPPRITLKKGTILIMDDEEGIRNVMAMTLRRLGHEVGVAKDGQQAVDAYAKAKHEGHPFDCVFLDMTVRNGMGGHEAMLELLKIDSSVKAVLMTGYSSDPTFIAHQSLGYKAALAKPFDVKELRDILSGLTES